MESQRFEACTCHPGVLGNVPECGVEIDYGNCARVCVFCGRQYTKANYLRNHAKGCKASSSITIRSHTKGQLIVGHSWKYNSTNRIAAETPKICYNPLKPLEASSDIKFFLAECLDGFDDDIRELLLSIPLTKVEYMPEETMEVWSRSTTTWPRILPAEDLFQSPPPSSETLIEDILQSSSGFSALPIFCNGDRDDDIKPISIVTQLFEPNAKRPLAILGIRPTCLPRQIFIPPVSFSTIVEPSYVNNQQILLTTRFWETDLHIDVKDRFSAPLGPAIKLWMIFPPTDTNLRLMKEADGGKAKMRRIGKRLEHGILFKTTSKQTIYLPSGCIHYVLTIRGGFLIAIDFLARESSKALSSMIAAGLHQCDPKWYAELFSGFLQSIELGLKNNAVDMAVSSWIRAGDLIGDYATRNKGWKKNACKVWNDFFRSVMSRDVTCSCEGVMDGTFEQHFRGEHLFL